MYTVLHVEARGPICSTWRSLREEEVTALVTPWLEYVGGLEPGTIDIRFAGDDQIAHLGEGLRNLVSSLDDDCSCSSSAGSPRFSKTTFAPARRGCRTAGSLAGMKGADR
jgi:hypothetical protein